MIRKFLNSIFTRKDVLIVGGGPAGLYLAKNLLSENKDIGITIYEKDKNLFGLLKSGIAPDNFELKNIIKSFIPIIKRCKVLTGKYVKLDYLSNTISFLLLDTIKQIE